MPAPSVAGFCAMLSRSRLLAADEVRDLPRRWQADLGRPSEDTEAFARWLVEKRCLTAYQAEMLLRGHADRFFFGEYKLLERLGQGRMAGIYKASHRLGQVVAIKVLPPSKVKDAQAFGRFQREARLALKLKHPNVVRTFQAGEERGLHYIVMEYLDGETLEDVLRQRGKLPIPEAVMLVHQALQGLQHLYEQDMVHRDLKPANLMLVPAEGQPNDLRNATIRVLDVGLGRALFDEGDSTSAGPIELTTPGELLGSPDYVAPEQARDARIADIRADIYSLGCVFYHALAGRPPFPDGNAVRKLVRHATEAPTPIEMLRPDAPDGLEAILERMLAKDPAWRYATPDTAAQALKPFLPRAIGPLSDPETDPRMSSYLVWLASGAGAVPLAMPVGPPSPPLALPVAAAAVPPRLPTVPSAPAAVQVEEEEEDSAGFNLTRRDWLLLALGGLGLAAVIGGGVLFFGRRRRGRR